MSNTFCKPFYLPQSKGKCCTLSCSPAEQTTLPCGEIKVCLMSVQCDNLMTHPQLYTSNMVSFGSFILYSILRDMCGSKLPEHAEHPDGLTPLRADRWLTFTDTAIGAFFLHFA